MKNRIQLLAILLGLTVGAAACATPTSNCSVFDDGATVVIACDDGTTARLSDGEDGEDGRDGASCTVSVDGDGTKNIACDDGTTAVVRDGADGSACGAYDNGDGTKTIRCDDGTEATVSDGAGCTVADMGEGVHRVDCGDGSTTFIRDGQAAEACTVFTKGEETVLACPDSWASIQGADDSTSCSIVDYSIGRVIECSDGTWAHLEDPAEDDTPCRVLDQGDGTAMLRCSDGTESIIATCSVDAGDGEVRCGPQPLAPATEMVPFPSADDERRWIAPGVYWHEGDFVQGERTTSLEQVSGGTLHLEVENNVLSCDGQRVRFFVGDEVVARFTVRPGDRSLDFDFELAEPVEGPVVVRLETSQSVASFCGGAGYASTSTVELRGMR